MSFYSFIACLPGRMRTFLRRSVKTPIVSKAFGSCGKNFHLGAGVVFAGIENVFVGDNVYIGGRNTFMTTRAKIVMGNDIMFGPNVLIVTGNHRTDIPGKPMIQVSDAEKRPEDDMDVVIKDDCWIGGNSTILKGVTIETGCVIAAGAVVTKSTEPYGIYGGVPAKRLSDRFSN